MVLFRNRRKLNPELPANFGDDIKDDPEMFNRGAREYRTMKRQIEKLKIRQENSESLKAIEFIFEDYVPRCWLFPVFECFRRVFLTAFLGAIHPGTLSQAVVGFVGAAISQRVFAYFRPFVEDSDNVVSEFAQTELVIIFFAALVLYVSSETDHRGGLFRNSIFGVLLCIIFSITIVVSAYGIVVDHFGFARLDKLRNKALAATRDSFDSARHSLGSASRHLSYRFRSLSMHSNDYVGDDTVTNPLNNDVDIIIDIEKLGLAAPLVPSPQSLHAHRNEPPQQRL